MSIDNYTTQRIGVTPGSSQPALVGSRPYTITRMLAASEQTQVYAAVETGRAGERPVVIKVARGGACSLERHRLTCHDLHSEAIMLREIARLGLPGPHFRAIFHVDGYAHLVMSHIDGTNLADLSRRHAITPRATVAAIWQICQIAATIHAAGYVHHDIKPANIMLRPDGSALLIDWGSAQRVRPAGDCRAQSYTPDFACAAQRRGEARPSNDIFAIGRTLARAIPWPSRSLRTIIARATARSTRIYMHVAQLADALERLLWWDQQIEPLGLSMLVSSD